MKNLKNNKKGFTLIELLAVIVILAILVMVAIPAVTKYLTTSRNSTFLDNAESAISAVRNDYVINGMTNASTKPTTSGGSIIYNKDKINALLEKPLKTSPFGADYKAACVKITDTNSATSNDITGSANVKYEMCLLDNDGHGFSYLEEGNLKMSDTTVTCSC